MFPLQVTRQIISIYFIQISRWENRLIKSKRINNIKTDQNKKFGKKKRKKTSTNALITTQIETKEFTFQIWRRRRKRRRSFCCQTNWFISKKIKSLAFVGCGMLECICFHWCWWTVNIEHGTVYAVNLPHYYLLNSTIIHILFIRSDETNDGLMIASEQ